MKKLNQNGFSAVEVFLIIVILGLIGFVGWFVYHSQQNVDKTYSNSVNDSAQKATAIKTFADCKKAAGSKILTTSPEQCVTKSGKTFTNNTNYLAIREWGVKIDTSDSALSGAMYVMTNSTNGVDRVELVTHNTLEMDYTCGGNGTSDPVTHNTASDQDYLLRSKVTDQLEIMSNHPAADFTKIGDYYYIYARNTGHDNCSISDASLAKQASDAANAFATAKITTL